MTDRELLEKLIKAGEEMRKKQAEYFQAAPSARKAILPAAKAAEKAFDNTLYNVKQFMGLIYLTNPMRGLVKYISPKVRQIIEPLNASFEDVIKVLAGAPPDAPITPLIEVNKKLGPWVNKVHCSDCITFMDQLPVESISCIVTSPPYNLKNSTGNGMKDGRGGKWPNAALQKGYEGHHDNMPHDEYVEWQRNCLTAMMRVLKNDGVIFYNHKWRVQGGMLQDRHDIVEGFPVRQIIIWKRAGGINFNAGYFLPTYEVIYMICKPDFKLADGANKMGDVWEIPQVKGNDHPAPFPVELAQRCIEASPSGIILDPFMGSGTTAIAAINQNRDWIGVELSKEYCTLANTRIAEYQKKVQPKLKL